MDGQRLYTEFWRGTHIAIYNVKKEKKKEKRSDERKTQANSGMYLFALPPPIHHDNVPSNALYVFF
jgi:hypothetical protein